MQDFIPEFLPVPSTVILDKRLQPQDRIVMGTIMYFVKLKEGRCRASNATIGRLSGCTDGTAKNSILRLQKFGYIRCKYKDTEKRIREEIIPTLRSYSDSIRDNIDIDVYRGVASPDATGSINRCHGVASPDAQIKKENKREIAAKNAAGADSSEKIDFNLEVQKLIDSEQEHIQLIGYYANNRKKTLSSNIKTKGQLSKFIGRHAKAAASITKAWSADQVKRAIEQVKKKYPSIDWTLETIEKQLTK